MPRYRLTSPNRKLVNTTKEIFTAVLFLVNEIIFCGNTYSEPIRFLQKTARDQKTKRPRTAFAGQFYQGDRQP